MDNSVESLHNSKMADQTYQIYPVINVINILLPETNVPIHNLPINVNLQLDNGELANSNDIMSPPIPNINNPYIICFNNPTIIPNDNHNPYIILQNINNNTQKKKHVKNKFAPSEDQKLIDIVKKYNEIDINWEDVAKQLNTGRNSRQCRERWSYYLSPHICKEPWTKEEDDLLLKKYKELGPKWKKLSSFFKSRTDINLKNRWNLLQRKFNKEARRFVKLAQKKSH